MFLTQLIDVVERDDEALVVPLAPVARRSPSSVGDPGHQGSPRASTGQPTLEWIRAHEALLFQQGQPESAIPGVHGESVSGWDLLRIRKCSSDQLSIH
jgi:hypothetical protein